MTMAAIALASWGAQAWGQGAAPEFSLPDVNATSITHGMTVSPRDYVGRVSGWYFGYST